MCMINPYRGYDACYSKDCKYRDVLEGQRKVINTMSAIIEKLEKENHDLKDKLAKLQDLKESEKSKKDTMLCNNTCGPCKDMKDLEKKLVQRIENDLDLHYYQLKSFRSNVIDDRAKIRGVELDVQKINQDLILCKVILFLVSVISIFALYR